MPGLRGRQRWGQRAADVGRVARLCRKQGAGVVCRYARLGGGGFLTNDHAGPIPPVPAEGSVRFCRHGPPGGCQWLATDAASGFAWRRSGIGRGFGRGHRRCVEGRQPMIRSAAGCTSRRTGQRSRQPVEFPPASGPVAGLAMRCGQPRRPASMPPAEPSLPSSAGTAPPRPPVAAGCPVAFTASPPARWPQCSPARLPAGWATPRPPQPDRGQKQPDVRCLQRLMQRFGNRHDSDIAVSPCRCGRLWSVRRGCYSSPVSPSTYECP